MRPPSHIISEHALDIFRSKLPREWIFRPQPAQDYGIDAEIELVDTSGILSGEVIKVQVKGHQRMRFSEGVYRENVKGSTAGYWLRLRMPIILVSVDLTTETAYWTDIARSLREQSYDALIQPRVTIPIAESSAFQPPASLDQLVGKARYDYDWRATNDRFEAALDRMPEILRFAAWLDRCDTWMPLEREEARRLRSYDKLVRTIAAAADLNTSTLHSIRYWEEAARQRGFDGYYELPYEFGAAACWELLPLYFESLIARQMVITESELSFWFGVDEGRFHRWFDEEFPQPTSVESIKELAYAYEEGSM